MTNTPSWIKAAIAERKQQSLFRKTVVMESAQSPSVRVDDSDYLAFCSNDYLGLANHPDLVKALHQSALEYGVGSGASHLVNGHSRVHQLLEEELADWLGYERVMLFSTGYMANLGVISALAGKNTLVLQDKLNHASLLDGAKLAEASLRRYLHNDLASAERLLSKEMSRAKPSNDSSSGNSSNEKQSPLLVTDGVFSMDGDIAPLKKLSTLAQKYSSILMVDDAHGLACIGKEGKGVMELEGVTSHDLPLLVGTFGKAFGTSGAFVATSNDMADYLTQFARPYIYTTAMSPAMAGATRASLALIRSAEGQERREKLAKNIAFFREKANQLPISLGDSQTAIQPVIVGDSEYALLLSQQLKQRGIWCTAIRPPTVPNAGARLRITLSARHTQQQICQLTQTLSKVMDKRG